MADWTPFSLVLIDVQRDFWPQGRAREFPHFPHRVPRLLDLCRSEGLDILHLRAEFAPDGSDWMPRYRLGGGIPCVQGTPGAEALSFAVERPGETVLTKQSFDGFVASGLQKHLRGKRFLLLAGLETSVCVLFTAASAVQHGFLVAVVSDCCADELAAHELTLGHYPFLFDTTAVEDIPARHEMWQRQLASLDGAGPTPGTSRA